MIAIYAMRPFNSSNPAAQFALLLAQPASLLGIAANMFSLALGTYAREFTRWRRSHSGRSGNQTRPTWPAEFLDQWTYWPAHSTAQGAMFGAGPSE